MKPINSNSAAKLFLVGAGPGALELLTIQAYKTIEMADIVLYDRLVGDEILNFAEKHATLINVGKKPGEQDKKQAVIYRELIKHNIPSNKVVRLKGGDPMVFARGIEEWLFAKELGYEVSYIPGVSSATSVPGNLGIPLTARDVSSSFAVLTGNLKNGKFIEDFSKFSKIDTLAVLMGVKTRKRIAEELIKAGKPGITPCAFIENGTKPNQKIITSSLLEVRDKEIEVSSPAIFIIGEVVLYHKQLLSLGHQTFNSEFLNDEEGVENNQEVHLAP